MTFNHQIEASHKGTPKDYGHKKIWEGGPKIAFFAGLIEVGRWSKKGKFVSMKSMRVLNCDSIAFFEKNC